MTDTSPILAMPYIQPSQAQKHVTHNEALRLLDMIVQLAVLSAASGTPPTTAEDGDRYLVGPTGQGAWADHDHDIAVFVDADWQFLAPQAGWVAQVLDTGAEVVFDGSIWAGRSQNNLPGLGIGAAYDGYNRLVVASDAVLFNNAGAGHQVKVNKATQGDTASLLFQTGYGGRAEMGTAGNDDFSLKVSPDGASWTEALRVEAATGRVSVGVGGWREMLVAPRTYFVDPDLGNDTQDGLTSGSGAFATVEHAVSLLQGLDSGGHDITLHLAHGTYTFAQAIRIGSMLVGGGNLVVEGDIAAPEQVTLAGTDTVFIIEEGSVIMRGLRVQNSGTAAAVVVGAWGSLAVDQVVLGTAGGHFSVQGGQLAIAGPCTIEGGAAYHLRLDMGARYAGNGQSVTVNNAPGFTEAFVICTDASIARFDGQSYSAGATGKRYSVTSNGVIQTGGTPLPGDVAGSAQTGGQYI